MYALHCLLLLVCVLKCSSQSCEEDGWYCEATAQCVGYNQTCAGACYIIARHGRDHNGGFNYNNDIYYCSLTDSCHTSDTPCGDYCHPRKVAAPGPGHQYTYIDRVLCQEEGRCYEGGSVENIVCRNTLYNCSDGQHWCEETGTCQDNTETCSDYCDVFQEYYDSCENNCLAPGHEYCDLSATCTDNTCTDGCEEGYWYCNNTQSCVPVTQPCGDHCVDYTQVRNTGKYS